MTESEIAKSLPPRKVCLSCAKEYSTEMIICPDDDTLLTPLLVDTLIGTIDVSEMFLEGASEYAERLFFKVKAISGAITKEIQRR